MWLESFRISNLFGFRKRSQSDAEYKQGGCNGDTPSVRWCKTGYNRLSDVLRESDDPNGNFVQSSSVSFIYDDSVFRLPSDELQDQNDESSNGRVLMRQSITLQSLEETLTDISSNDSDEDDEIVCCVCDEGFKTHKQLTNHRQRSRHFGCSVCEEIFANSLALDVHKEECDHWSEGDDDDEEEWEDESDFDDVLTPLQEKIFI